MCWPSGENPTGQIEYVCLVKRPLNGKVMRQEWGRFGSWELNASRYSSFFGGRIDTFRWYIWGAVGQVRRGFIDRYRYAECDWLGRLRRLPNIILEDTRD